jgi:hypothetical protein
VNLDTVIAEVIARYPDLAADDDRARFILGNLSRSELLGVVKNHLTGMGQFARLVHEFDCIVAPASQGLPPIPRALPAGVRPIRVIPDGSGGNGHREDHEL